MSENMPLGLFALAMGGFGIGLTEFVIMGLLPEIARDFHVTEAVAGWLISGYALSVGIGGVIMTAAVMRFNRKRVLLCLMLLFIAGNLLSALSPNYGVMLLGRVVAALCHGAFFGIGAVVAVDLVAPNKRAGAISTMFAGLTMATVLGVPFGTLLGQRFGWHAVFWAITIIGIIALVGLALLIPSQSRSEGASEVPNLRRELGAFTNPQVWFSIAVTILGFGGMFGAFTYIAYILTDVSGFAAATVPGLLILFGVGTFLGNILGGKAADKSLRTTLTVTLVLLTVVLVLFALTAQHHVMAVLSLFLMGTLGFAAVPGLQMRIMQHAAEAPTMASGANIAAFNLGNALGAWLGGVTISAGLGYTAPIWAGAALTFVGLVVLLLADRFAKQPILAHTSPLPDTLAPQAAPCP